MFGVRLSKMGSASKLGLVAKAIAILRKYGTDAHVYLPGIGTVSGLTAGNYLNSAGTTAATVDNPVGLSLDALQAMTLGAELVVNSGFDSDTAWTKGTGVTISGGAAIYTGFTTTTTPTTPLPALANSSYVVTGRCGAYNSGTLTGNFGGASFTISTGGTAQFTQVVNTTTTGNFSMSSAAFDGSLDFISIKQIPGIHLSQATTANKPVLKQSGAKYYWQHDSTDLLTATYPAGYESATIIDAVTSGVVTNQGVNVVGSYSIGPSVNTAGRILMRTAPTAPELAVLQAYARSLI